MIVNRFTKAADALIVPYQPKSLIAIKTKFKVAGNFLLLQRPKHLQHLRRKLCLISSQRLPAPPATTHHCRIALHLRNRCTAPSSTASSTPLPMINTNRKNLQR